MGKCASLKIKQISMFVEYFLSENVLILHQAMHKYNFFLEVFLELSYP